MRGSLWYQFVQCSILVIGGPFLRLRWWGVNHIPDEGPVLLVSNHQSHFDPPLLGATCPRPINFVARDTLFQSKFLAALIRSLNAFPISRDGSPLAGIKAALKALKAGEIVLVFPEGTRTLDGEIAELKPGFVSLAKRGKATIVPVAIEGAFDAWPRGTKWPRSRTVHLAYGEPIPADEVARLGERELIVEIDRHLRDQLARLREHPEFADRETRPSFPCATQE